MSFRLVPNSSKNSDMVWVYCDQCDDVADFSLYEKETDLFYCYGCFLVIPKILRERQHKINKLRFNIS
jgi:hypothetical protein